METQNGSSNSRIWTRHPLSHLVLPAEVNPRILPWQQELHTHIEDASRLKARHGGATPVVLKVVFLLRVIESQALLTHRRHLP